MKKAEIIKNGNVNLQSVITEKGSVSIKLPQLTLNSVQLERIVLILEKHLEEAQNLQAKNRGQGRKEDEKYYMGREDAFEIILDLLK